MTHKRGNPNWGKPAPLVAPSPSLTAFERQVRALRLNEKAWRTSERLKVWCKENKNRCYIPENLLAFWNITVDPHVRE